MDFTTLCHRPGLARRGSGLLSAFDAAASDSRCCVLLVLRTRDSHTIIDDGCVVNGGYADRHKQQGIGEVRMPTEAQFCPALHNNCEDVP